jgi:hypothetical protein
VLGHAGDLDRGVEDLGRLAQTAVQRPDRPDPEQDRQRLALAGAVGDGERALAAGPGGVAAVEQRRGGGESAA